MTKLWWAQIKSVIRLEMKKTFFARRGLWIYILALLPLLLFVAQAINVSHEHGRQPHRGPESEKANGAGFARRQTGHDERGSDCVAGKAARTISLEPATDNCGYERGDRDRRHWNTGESGASVQPERHLHGRHNLHERRCGRCRLCLFLEPADPEPGAEWHPVQLWPRESTRCHLWGRAADYAACWPFREIARTGWRRLWAGAGSGFLCNLYRRLDQRVHAKLQRLVQFWCDARRT